MTSHQFASTISLISLRRILSNPLELSIVRSDHTIGLVSVLICVFTFTIICSTRLIISTTNANTILMLIRRILWLRKRERSERNIEGIVNDKLWIVNELPIRKGVLKIGILCYLWIMSNNDDSGLWFLL